MIALGINAGKTITAYRRHLGSREVGTAKATSPRSTSLMQQTEQMARRHDVWHYALWSMIQQSEILFAQGFLQAAWETQEKAFQLIRDQHRNSCRCTSFCCAFVPSQLWGVSAADEAEATARHGVNVLSTYQLQQQLQCLTLLVQCSLARGDLDNARNHLNRLKTCSATVNITATGFLTPIQVR